MEEEEESAHNLWSSWAHDIEEEVKEEIVDGDLPNAHFSPVFYKHLVADIKHLPMWSCAFRDSVGYGRVPASSASVESEFNKVKNVIFKGELGTIRVDTFLENHITILDGKMLLTDAAMATEKVVEETGFSSIDQDFVSEERASKRCKIDSLDDSINEDDLVKDDYNLSLDNYGNHVIQNMEDETIEEEKNEEVDCRIKKKCPVCANGHQPTGAHTCAACDKAVHILEECSYLLPDTSEGYGEKRICVACHDTPAAKEIIASRHVENWRGLGKNCLSQSRASKYLNNENHLSDAMSFPHNQMIPIMKNGSAGCGVITKGSTSIGIKNTCAFDSILQVMILVCTENHSIRTFSEVSRNPFLDLALYISSKGLKGAHAYQSRTKILYEYLSKEKERISKNEVDMLDCAMHISKAISLIFRYEHSCVEVSKCTDGCTNKTKHRAAILLPYADLFKNNFDTGITNVLALPARPCSSCSSMVNTTVTKMGDLMFFEVEDADLKPKIQLQRIPPSYAVSQDSERYIYKLVGIVNFIPLLQQVIRASKRSQNPTTIGHYTAVCPRLGNKWMEFDDTKEKAQLRKPNALCCPALLIYAQTHE